LTADLSSTSKKIKILHKWNNNEINKVMPINVLLSMASVDADANTVPTRLTLFIENEIRGIASLELTLLPLSQMCKSVEFVSKIEFTILGVAPSTTLSVHVEKVELFVSIAYRKINRVAKIKHATALRIVVAV